MSADVHALPGVVQRSDRKAFVLNEIAASYDKYVGDYGVEPDAFALVLGGVRKVCRLSWTAQGETEGATSTFLALAGVVITKELVNPD